jgi:hypothetical protein
LRRARRRAGRSRPSAIGLLRRGLRHGQRPLLAPEVGIGRWPTASHIGNAILREDARGARLAKERKDSPRRIDAAVAAVMAHDRAAALARDSIYL